MPVPRVAIVGRPNVGKSSLLNMIAGAKVSIVDPTPGVTRDRVSVLVDLPDPDGGPPKTVEFTDTGGWGVYTAEGGRYDDVGHDLHALTRDIEFQIGEAVRTADLVLFAVDAQAGVTPQDEEIARLLREGKLGAAETGPTAKGAKEPEGHEVEQGEAGDERGQGRGLSPGSARALSPSRAAPSRSSRSPARPPVRVVATKTDGPRWEAHAFELAALGFGEPLLCSARNNYFRRELMDELFRVTPAPEGPATEATADLRLAIIGKRNAGKSTLVNALAGAPRVIVSEIPGTTRDAVDVRFEMDGRSLLAIDTAGLRRRKSFKERVEWFALDRAKRAIERADVVFLLLDATEKLSQVDEHLAQMVRESFKPCVLVVNKWDLVEGGADDHGRPVTPQRYDEYLRRELRALDFAPIAFVSAERGTNLRQAVGVAFDLHRQAGERVTTGVLNRLVRSLVERLQPTSKIGHHVKVFYVAQVGTHPPTIALVVNHPELFVPAYEKFLVNRFREELPFSEVPIRLKVRGRSQKGKEAVELQGEGAAPAAETAERMMTEEDAAAYFEEED